MGKPDVTVIQSNGNLGRVAPSADGVSALVVSGIAVGGQFALGDVLGPFTSPADAELKGITAAYDATNTCLAYKHISDFYETAGLGTELYVMVVAKTVTMTDLCDKTMTYAKKLLSTTGGKIFMIGITRCPDGAYVPTYTDQFEADLWTAVTKAGALRVEEYDLHRPVSFILEGRNFQGNASSTKDLRDVAGPLQNRVAIAMGSDMDFIADNAYASKYANVGYVLGQFAGRPVQRNIGRVKDGKLSITNAGFSNGAAYDTLTETNTDSLHDHGYIFMRKHSGIDGFFFNDDPVATKITDDYSSFSAGRTMDKVARITRQVYLQELLDDIELDPTTGKLAVSTVKAYQGAVESEINLQMTSKKEIVRVTAFCDPNQNVTATDQVKIDVKVRRKGMAKDIEATLAFEATTI